MALSMGLWVALVINLKLCVWVQGSEVTQETQDSGLCQALIIPQGNYDCEEFVVNTDDGFMLGVQRLAANGRLESKNTPVFLMHGILSGGDTWFLNPTDQSLGFILADAGYDVWIGNFRTTDFSHGHTRLQKDDKDYWDWSVDELAEKDLVSMLELVYKSSGSRLHYIGFSQGTQAAFAALSQGLLQDWLDKIVMIAPVAYVTHATTPLGIVAGRLHLDQVFNGLQFYSLSTKTNSGKEFVDILCAAANMRCFNTWATMFTGVNCCINDTRRPLYDKYETQATSTKNLQHLGQQLRQGTFAKFNYGLMGNMLRYMSMGPPSYDLSRVPTRKMLLVHGENDALSDVKDVLQLSGELTQGYQRIYIQDYAHVDFIVGFNANVKVYKEVLGFIES